MTKSWPGNNGAQLKRAAPFDDPEWIYELKMDGFRALAHRRAWPCSVALTQRASVRFVLCVGRINLRFAAECESRHSWDTTIQKSAIPPWKPAVLLRIRFVDLRREGFTN